MGDINAGTLYIGAAYNGEPIERGLAKTKKSLLGFSRFQAGIMKGVLGANIASSVGRFVWQAAMANKDVRKLSDSIKEAGANVMGFLLKPFTEVAKVINDIKDAKIMVKAASTPLTSEGYKEFLKQRAGVYDKEMALEETIKKAEDARNELRRLMGAWNDLIEAKQTYDTTFNRFLPEGTPSGLRAKSTIPFGGDKYFEDVMKKAADTYYKLMVKPLEDAAKGAINPKKEGTGGFVGEAYLNTRKSIMEEWVKTALMKPQKDRNIGQWMGGADVWKRAVSGSLQVNYDKQTAANTKQLTDIGQDILNKIASLGGLN